MKNILFLSVAVLLTVSIVSCKKADVAKDVDLCILKLNKFNESFASFYKDEVISKDTLKNEQSSEFDQLKKIAGEYYDLMNKINSQIEEERENVKKGKKSKGYEEAYNKVLSEKKDVIEKSTSLFIENINIMNGEVETNANDTIPAQVENANTGEVN